MFLAVLAASLFVLSAATGGSSADSCASLSPIMIVVAGGDGCSASKSEFVSPHISALQRDAIRCMLPGRSRKYPANSCAELA